jgi:UDP-N-acetylmuramoyl-L-alanyl-D-glutamate--2,6-diaminopimelate ligase
MKLADLAAGFPVTPPGANPEITGITDDSRRVTPGSLFVAVPGTAFDGHAFVADAMTRGAGAVVLESRGAEPAGLPFIRVASSRRALAELAARFYRHPDRELTLIGFTGTFGKTSTSEILRAILDAAGGQTGVLGSLGARYRGFHQPAGELTTPAPVELHRALRGVRDAGAAAVIMEVTSHALRLGRVEGLKFDGGLLAGIMPGEHTDFHRTYESYVGAKRLFLDYLRPGAVLAYDGDNHAARRLAADARDARPAGFSLGGRGADLQFYDVLLDHRGAAFSIAGTLATQAPGARLGSRLLGRGHLRNVALALTYALAAGVPVDVAASVLPGLRPLRRRMEQYDIGGRTVLDDTAAHPDSFRSTFEVADLLPHDTLALVYAVRGNRGADINRRNADALAELAVVHGSEVMIVTASADAAAEKDRATADEIDAARQAFTDRGVRFVWHDSLRTALGDALARTRAGDLLVLVGAQGMDQGKALLEESI